MDDLGCLDQAITGAPVVVNDDQRPRVLRDTEHNRFVVEDHGARAELVYRRMGSRLVLVHTEVPEDLGGRGIGGQLVRAAVEWAAADGLVVTPWCPFARKWLGDHADAAAAATIDWENRPPERDSR